MDPNTSESQKRYIRTFAGDIEAIQKGDKPDLSPLSNSSAAEPKSTPAERLVAPSPIVETPIISPAPVIISDQPKSEREFQGPIPIKTYSGDFSEKIKEEEASPVTVLAAEQDAKENKIDLPQIEVKNFNRRNLIYTIAGGVLVLAGGLSAYVAYTKHLSSLTQPLLTPSIATPIFVDEREEISGVGVVLLRAIEQSLTRQLSTNTIRLLYTISATTTDNSVFSALQEPAPNVLLRNLNAGDSMAGIINIKGVQSPFFILSVSSYGNTFSGMLSWEPTMARDLKELFSPFVDQAMSASIATSTATTTKTSSPVYDSKQATSSIQKISAGFRDEIINNHDVRVYRDSSGRSILLYGYWDQNTLIIAHDPPAFMEILNRLANSRDQH